MNIDEEIKKQEEEKIKLQARIIELRQEINACSLRIRRLQTIKRHAEEAIGFKVGDTKTFIIDGPAPELPDPKQLDMEIAPVLDSVAQEKIERGTHHNDAIDYVMRGNDKYTMLDSEEEAPQSRPDNTVFDLPELSAPEIATNYKSKRDPKPKADKPVAKEVIKELADEQEEY